MYLQVSETIVFGIVVAVAAARLTTSLPEKLNGLGMELLSTCR